MSDRTCASCDQPVRDQDEICRACLKATKGRLRRIPDLARDLEISLARQAVLTERNDGGKSAETSLAFNEAAGAALRALRSVLVGWCRLLHDERGVHLPHDTMPALAAHLDHHAADLVTHAAAGEFVDEISAATNEATRVIDLPANRTRIAVGPCPEDYTDDLGRVLPCTGKVIATVPNDETVRPFMACTHCDAQWLPEQWHRAGDRIMRRAGVTRIDPEAAEALLRLAS